MERAPTILIDPEIAEQLLHYRTSCMQHTEDRAEECAQRIATWKAPADACSMFLCIGCSKSLYCISQTIICDIYIYRL